MTIFGSKKNPMSAEEFIKLHPEAAHQAAQQVTFDEALEREDLHLPDVNRYFSSLKQDGDLEMVSHHDNCWWVDYKGISTNQRPSYRKGSILMG